MLLILVYGAEVCVPSFVSLIDGPSTERIDHEWWGDCGHAVPGPVSSKN